MKTGIKFLFLGIICCLHGYAQLPETDIFLVPMKVDGSKIKFGKPENITARKGYDNQPYFTYPLKQILYTAVPDSTQSDIFSFDLRTREKLTITNTPESEYSPSYTPNGKNVTVVRVDKDSSQHLYYFHPGSGNRATMIQGTDSVGYYCWINDTLLSMFILGTSNTLQILNLRHSTRKLVTNDIGRCMKLSKDKKSLYFVKKETEKEWFICEMNIADNSFKKITATLPGSEDFTLLRDNTILSGQDGKLYSLAPGTSTWQQRADFNSTVGNFYRIATNVSDSLITLVGFTGKKP